MKHAPLVPLVSLFLLAGLADCNKGTLPEAPDVVTLQLSLETSFAGRDRISRVEIILDARDPSAQVVFAPIAQRTGSVSGFPIRWESRDVDSDGALEQVITIQGNPFAQMAFFMPHVVPEVTLAIPVKIFVLAKDSAGAEIGWGFACDNQGQDIYLGIRQIVGITIRGTRRDPCPPCRWDACDSFGNCPLGFTCSGECCHCDQACGDADGGMDGGTCTGDLTCVDGCCLSGGKNMGEDCTGNSQCSTGFCVDGKCCDSECTAPCNTCAAPGNQGTCSVVVNGDDTPQCRGDSTCDGSGRCLLRRGVSCTSANECLTGFCESGKCCNADCPDVCHTCAVPGNEGICIQLPPGTQDDPDCTGASACGADGACLLKNGQDCTGSSECASGHCKDGKCCNTGCALPCHTCAAAGHEGTCRQMETGQVDSPECMGTFACSAAGVCLLRNGESCTGNLECASGHCKDGRCCNTECTTPCYSCLTGTCTLLAGTDDAPECVGDYTCGNSGACLLKNGRSSTLAESCASGFAKDGVCCNQACTAPCHECSTGACRRVPVANDDIPECTGSTTCSASGVCLLKLGRTCTGASECASGYCVDGKCCDTECELMCHSCKTGACQQVPALMEDAPDCLGEYACSLSGECLLKTGRNCSRASDCASGFCVDGKCCDVECAQPCFSCATGACLQITGEADVPQCSGYNACDAQGRCSLTSIHVSPGKFNHACAVMKNHTVRCWGKGLLGQLGNGTSVEWTPSPVAVRGVSDALEVAAGGMFACALIRDGTVQCWGLNNLGQLGDGTTMNRNTPAAVAGLSGAKQIQAGFWHACALLDNGTVQCWGANRIGELGNGNPSGPETCPGTGVSPSRCRV